MTIVFYRRDAEDAEKRTLLFKRNRQYQAEGTGRRAEGRAIDYFRLTIEFHRPSTIYRTYGAGRERPSTIYRTYPSTIFRSYGAGGAPIAGFPLR